MTVSTRVNKTIAQGDGVTTVFDYTFIPVAPNFFSVIYTDADGAEELLDPADYTLTINPVLPGQTWPTGGTVTYLRMGSPIDPDTSLTMFRTLPLEQAIVLANQASYGQYGGSAERGLDLGIMVAQQLADLLDRSIKVPITDAPPADLPSVQARANQGAVFDSNGNLTAGVAPASGFISAAMQPVVGAATLALGRAAFGLRGLATLGLGAGLEDDGADNARVNVLLEDVVGNRAITAADHMKRLIVTGPVTLTVDKVSTLWEGFQCFVEIVGGGTVMLAPNATDHIQGAGSGESVPLPIGSSFSLTTNALGAGTIYVDLLAPLAASLGGRLSLQTGVPVPLNNITAGTVFYEAFSGPFVPVWNGAVIVPMAIGNGLSASLAAGYSAGAAYDFFAAIVAGVLTLVTGPAWRNPGQFITGATNASPIVVTANAHTLQNGDDVVISGVLGNLAANGQWVVANRTANTFELVGSTGSGAYTAGTGQLASRGAGALTTQLGRVNGLKANAVDITARNGANTFTVLAGQATYLGSGLVDASGNTMTIHVRYGQNRICALYNAFNQVDMVLAVGDATASWALPAVGSPRPVNNTSANNAVIFRGEANSGIEAQSHNTQQSGGAGSGANVGSVSGIGFNYNGTAVYFGVAGLIASQVNSSIFALNNFAEGHFEAPPAMGKVNFTALEAGAVNSSTSFGGQNNNCMYVKFAA